MKNQNILKNQKGITLIVLVVTAIVLLILASVTVNMVLGKDDAIHKSREEADRKKEGIKQNDNGIEALLNDVKNVERENQIQEKTISINVKVNSFNESLGAMPVVYSIIGKKDAKTVLSTIATDNISSAGTHKVSVDVNVPEGTIITVTQKYVGESYDLKTEAEVQKLIESNKFETQFNFEYDYNYKLINSSSTKL